MEDDIFTIKLSGEPIGAPWESNEWDGDDDWEFTSAADDTPEQLYALWDGAVERSREARRGPGRGGLDQLVHVSAPDGRHASLRRLVCDLIEEYGRHTGHADLLREAVDGRVGEDPPDGWHPSSSGWRRARWGLGVDRRFLPDEDPPRSTCAASVRRGDRDTAVGFPAAISAGAGQRGGKSGIQVQLLPRIL